MFAREVNAGAATPADALTHPRAAPVRGRRNSSAVS